MVQKYDEIQDIKSDSTLNVVVKQITIKSVFVVSWSHVHKDSFAFLTLCVYIFQYLACQQRTLEAVRVMRRNDSLDVFFPGVPVELNLSFPLQKYKSITSFQDESRIRSLHSFILGPKIKIDHGPHKGVGCSITAQCG